MARSPSIPLLMLFAACTPDYGVKGSDSGTVDTDTGDTEEDLSVYEGATLQIQAPAAGAYLPLGEPATFAAAVLDADGNELSDIEVVWTSDIDTAWGATSATFEDDTLEVGTHTLTARASLPNGAVVSDRAGAILVQHEDAGTYVGNMILDVAGEFQGTPLTASCIGAAIVVVDATGEIADGGSDCIISLFGFEQSASVVFEFGVDDGDVEGESAVDLSFIQYGFETTGDVGDGTLSAVWSDNVFGFADIAGSMELERVTRDVE